MAPLWMVTAACSAGSLGDGGVGGVGEDALGDLGLTSTAYPGSVTVFLD
jgi:hypothetical protein